VTFTLDINLDHLDRVENIVKDPHTKDWYLQERL